MKHIKKIERVENIVGINYGEYLYWVIYGKPIDYIKVLQKILKERTDHNQYYVKIETLIDLIMRNSHLFNEYQGLFIISYSKGYEAPSITYRGFSDENAKNVYTSYYDNNGMTFKGELKIINNELVLDSFESDVKKYNL